MNKNNAISLINRENKRVPLTAKNTHWANLSVYGGQNGWWLNVPFNKFKENLFFVLNNVHSGQMLLIDIPSNSITNPKSQFRNKRNTADIFISAQSAQNLSDADQLIDIQSNGAGYDFSTFYVEVLEHFSDIGHLDNLYPEEVSNELKEGSKKLL